MVVDPNLKLSCGKAANPPSKKHPYYVKAGRSVVAYCSRESYAVVLEGTLRRIAVLSDFRGGSEILAVLGDLIELIQAHRKKSVQASRRGRR